MKTKSFLLILLTLLFFGCDKGYKDEIFIEKYQNIYGIWKYIYTVTQTGFTKNGDYSIKFIKYGLFQYDSKKKGKVIIVEQNENTLELDFGSLFPDIKYATIGLFQSGDSLMISPNNGSSSLYIRAK